MQARTVRLSTKTLALYAVLLIAACFVIFIAIFSVTRNLRSISESADSEIFRTQEYALSKYKNALISKNNLDITGKSLTQNIDGGNAGSKATDKSANTIVDLQDILTVDLGNLTQEQRSQLITELLEKSGNTLPNNTLVSPDGSYIYLIQKGDTLSEISQEFMRSVQEIAELNHIPNVDLIYADSSLRIPHDE